MKKYCIIGNDDRSNQLRKMYINEGKTLVDCNDADYVIAPIPFSRDGKNVTGEIIPVEELILLLKNKVIFTGSIIPSIKEKMKKIEYIDLMDLEEVAILNAIPTAEGAICEAIKNSDITLNGSNVLVIGYGKIGKVLSNMLRGFGARIFCEARNLKDIAFIEAMGYNSIYIDELNSYLPKMDYIFNTVPAVLLDQKNMKYINKECTIIDLASVPGGIDFEYAKNLNLNVTWALSLPSKVASKSSAIYLKNSIDKIIKEKYSDS
jgi:dipicolinate synthase subunit A